jgi:hypothetical protein
MTYQQLLKQGTVNEITEALLDLLQTELRYRHHGRPQEMVRETLIEFFERGRRIGAKENNHDSYNNQTKGRDHHGRF